MADEFEIAVIGDTRLWDYRLVQLVFAQQLLHSLSHAHLFALNCLCGVVVVKCLLSDVRVDVFVFVSIVVVVVY